MTDVTLIGAGVLGAAMGRRLLEEGYAVTVWNRTPQKAQALAERGAVVVESVREAVESSPVILVCVVDHPRTLELLRPAEVQRALAGRVVLQTSSSVSDQARELEAFTKAAGAELVEAPISHRPEEIGTETGFICACGSAAAYARVEAILKTLTQNLVHVGEEIGQASALFGVVIALNLGGLICMAHGLGLAHAEGIPLAKASQVLMHSKDLLMAKIPLELQVLAEGGSEPSETSVDIWREPVRHILEYVEKRGFNSDLWSFLEKTLKAGSEAGLGDRDVAAVGEMIGRGSLGES